MEDIYIIIEEQKDSFEQLKRTAKRYEVKEEKTCGYAQMVFEEIEAITWKFKEKHEKLQHIVRENTLNIVDIPYFIEEIKSILCRLGEKFSKF